MDRRFIGIAHAAFVLAVLALLNAGCTLPVCTTPEIVVTRTDDVARGVCTSRNCSLRQAIQASNSCSGEQVVRIPGGTYSLALTGAGEDSNASGDLDILDRVRIVGDGMPVIDGNASDRVLDIRSGVVVNMAGLVVQNGSISLRGGIDGDGGGIQNLGNLVATNMLIRDNVGRRTGNGPGGINNGYGATAVISHSAIISNFSEEGAGGILNSGEMTLDNVTVSGNDAYGIFNTGTLEITYSTITDNLPYQIQGSLGEVRINNSIIDGSPDYGSCRGIFLSNGFNIENFGTGFAGGGCNFTQPSDLSGVDPMLLPLSAYDGVTLPFHALDSASPAIDSADPAHCSGTDQVGIARPVGTACDRGAKERAFIYLAPGDFIPLISSPTPTGIYLFIDPILPPIIPSPTPTPLTPAPASASFILTVGVPANCRQGPGTVYSVVNSALPGEQVEVLGKSADGTWWYSQLKNDKCWISNIAGTPQGDLNLLQVIPAPPTPVPTATEPPEQEEKPKPTDEVIVDPDNDGDGYPFSKDCNDKDPKIHSGAVETPDDKVDSNCNGDDDK